MTALYVLFGLASLGTLLSGVAAVVALLVQGHVKNMRTELNGQTQQLVSTSHELGVSEGREQARAESTDQPPASS